MSQNHHSGGMRGRPWQRTRRHILERDNYRCQIQLPGCTILATEVDHIQPLARGGPPLDPANLRAACRHCNQARGTPTTTASRNW